jgi:hypothetical protein
MGLEQSELFSYGFTSAYAINNGSDWLNLPNITAVEAGAPSECSNAEVYTNDSPSNNAHFFQARTSLGGPWAAPLEHFVFVQGGHTFVQYD